MLFENSFPNLSFFLLPIKAQFPPKFDIVARVFATDPPAKVLDILKSDNKLLITASSTSCIAPSSNSFFFKKE